MTSGPGSCVSSRLLEQLETSFAHADILVIAGPSSVGKTAVAAALAAACGGEVVSCDAMQVYREPVVVSDRPSPEVLALAPHHLLGVVSVEEAFNAARYGELAAAAVEDVLARGRRPIVCGGSGMYLMALLDGLCAAPAADPLRRAALAGEADRLGAEALHQRLAGVDPASARRIGPRDRQRILRALEAFETAGQPLSGHREQREGLRRKYRVRTVVLSRPRDVLYARAGARVDGMVRRGLVEEVRTLLGLRLTPTASRLIGVPEIGGYLRSERSLNAALELMKQNTRRYIKRQFTWFRREREAEWIVLE